MGHNPTKNPFRRARLGLDVDTQAAVDEYKTRSVWSAWWQLDEAGPPALFHAAGARLRDALGRAHGRAGVSAHQSRDRR